MTLRTLNYESYGIFLIMGNAYGAYGSQKPASARTDGGLPDSDEVELGSNVPGADDPVLLLLPARGLWFGL